MCSLRKMVTVGRVFEKKQLSRSIFSEETFECFGGFGVGRLVRIIIIDYLKES